MAYEFLFVFHCNYGHILYRFRNKARYWSKNANFSYPLVFNLHDPLEPLRIYSQNLNTKKLTVRVPGLLGGTKILPKSSKSLHSVQQRHRQTTDGRLIPKAERNVDVRLKTDGRSESKSTLTRGQSSLTKSASRGGGDSPVRGHPRGSKVVPLNSWGRVSY